MRTTAAVLALTLGGALLLGSIALAGPEDTAAHVKRYAEGVYMQAFRQVREVPEDALGTATRSLDAVEPSVENVVAFADETGVGAVRQAAEAYETALRAAEELDAEAVRDVAGDPVGTARATVDHATGLAPDATALADEAEATAEAAAGEAQDLAAEAEEHAAAVAERALGTVPDADRVVEHAEDLADDAAAAADEAAGGALETAGALTVDATARADGLRDYGTRVAFHHYTTAKRLLPG